MKNMKHPHSQHSYKKRSENNIRVYLFNFTEMNTKPYLIDGQNNYFLCFVA